MEQSANAEEENSMADFASFQTEPVVMALTHDYVRRKCDASVGRQLVQRAEE